MARSASRVDATTPPAKKPCPPVPGPPPELKSDVIDYYLGTRFVEDDVAWVNGWGDNDARQLLEDLAVAKGLKRDYFLEDIGRTTRKEACISLSEVPPDPDVMPKGFFREKRAPLPDLPAGWELSVTSSPAGLTIAQTGFPAISAGVWARAQPGPVLLRPAWRSSGSARHRQGAAYRQTLHSQALHNAQREGPSADHRDQDDHAARPAPE